MVAQIASRGPRAPQLLPPGRVKAKNQRQGIKRLHVVVRLSTTVLLLLAAAAIVAPGAEARARPAVSLRVSATQADLGQKLLFSGRVRPNRRGETVLLQLSQHPWRTIARARLGRGSQFNIGASLQSAGQQRLRVRYTGDPLTRPANSPPRRLSVLPVPVGIHKIKHVVIIMQENRSFDEYFGTYPGADGFPPGTCVPDPATGGCIAPYHNPNPVNKGGPHGESNFEADLNGGAMNGFVAQAEQAQGCETAGTPQCETDVMGYKDESDIPNYWTYARNFVLQDHLFEPNRSWSLPSHLFLVSEWSALCTSPSDPYSCTNALQSPGDADSNPNDPLGDDADYAWTPVTYLLHDAGISWGYFVKKGIEPDCADDEERCPNAPRQGPATPGIWNPLPDFSTVIENREVGNIQDTSAFLNAAQRGLLPAVSWVIPSQPVSEHPPASVSAGEEYVTNLINKVMEGPDWPSTAIFLSWDDWGGFYDQVVPPVVDQNGYGFRVPGLVISPYAKHGFIDHQMLSHDAYNKFIEDDFLASQRLNPATDGRPDPRPDVRETEPELGNLVTDFDFHQAPRPPMILPR